MKKVHEEIEIEIKDLRRKASEAASLMGKLSARKSPRPKSFYKEIGKKGLEKRWGKKAVDTEDLPVDNNA